MSNLSPKDWGLALGAYLALALFCAWALSATPSRQPELLVFTAKWCPQCVREKPAVYAWARAKGVRVVEIDADQRPDLIKLHKVRQFPTYDFYSAGKPVWRKYSVKEFTP